MQLTIKGLLKQTSTYGLFQLIQKVVAFAVIPVYTHFLTPSEFGTLDILYLLVWFIGIVGGSKLDAAFIRYYAAAKANNDVGDLLSSSVFTVATIATVFCVVAGLSAKPVLNFMYSSKELPLAGFYLALAATWLQLVGSLPLAYLRVRQEARLVGLISLFQSLGGTIIGLFSVTVLGFGYQGILYGLVASGIIQVVLTYRALFRRTALTLNYSYASTLLKYALPMLPAPMFMYLLNYADRYFLLRYWTLVEVGVYAMAYKFAMLINVAVMAPFGEMWGANQFALFEAGKKQTYQSMALAYVSALCVIALCVIYFSYEVTLITFDESYHDLLSIVAPLSVGIAVWGIVPALDLGCQVRNKTWVRSLTTGVGAMVNIILNWLLIPILGLLGAALSTLIAFIVLAWSTYRMNRLLTDYYVDVKKTILLVLLLSVMSSLVYLDGYMSYVWFLNMRLCALAIFGYLALRINNIQMRYLIGLLVRRAKTL